MTTDNELKNKEWGAWNILSEIIPIKNQWQNEIASSFMQPTTSGSVLGHEGRTWACFSKLPDILALDSRILWNYILTSLQSSDYGHPSHWMEFEFTKTSQDREQQIVREKMKRNKCRKRWIKLCLEVGIPQKLTMRQDLGTSNLLEVIRVMWGVREQGGDMGKGESWQSILLWGNL